MQSPPRRTAKDLFLRMVDETADKYNRLDIESQEIIWKPTKTLIPPL